MCPYDIFLRTIRSSRKILKYHIEALKAFADVASCRFKLFLIYAYRCQGGA